MEFENVIMKYISDSFCNVQSVEKDEVNALSESGDKGSDDVVSLLCDRTICNKIHGHKAPSTFGNFERLR